MVVVVALARYFSDLRASRYMTLMQIGKACVISLVPMGLVALQPDLGTALTYLPPIAVGLFVRGIRPAALLSLLLGFVLLLPVSWIVLKPYQAAGGVTLLDSWRDHLGKRDKVTQSKNSNSSGRLADKALLRASQNLLGLVQVVQT